jgi:hypothetical protein
LPVSEHRQAGGTVLLITAGNLGRVKIRANDPFRRAGLFDFSDDCRLTMRDLVADGTDEITRRRLSGSLCFDNSQWLDS